MMNVSVRIIAGTWLWQKVCEQVEVTKCLKGEDLILEPVSNDCEILLNTADSKKCCFCLVEEKG
jgi:hypothetical protein